MKPAPEVVIESASLQIWADPIKRITDEAGTRIARHLPFVNARVEFRDDPAAVIPELGIGGFAPNGHVIQIAVDAKATGLAGRLEQHLPRILAHESHHCARWRGPGYGTTLGEALVTEGLADHFDLQVHGGEPYGWATALTDVGAQHWWREAKKGLWQEDCDHAEWFFNRNPTGPPFQAGYALGFRLVAAYLAANAECSAAELVHTPAELMLSECLGT